jgi:N-acetyl-anhydromuramyl-L-alanine amidase AmpD
MTIIDPPSSIVNKHMWVPQQNVFSGAQPGSALVIHKTGGGDGTAEGTASYFQTGTDKSAHFVVGQNGTVVQCVHLVDGAGANCCADDSHNAWWNPLIAKYTNLNLCTISIEHCDQSTSNSTPLTSAQKASSFKLIKWLVDQYGFDIHNEIRPHNSIDATICPGNFPWNEMISYLQGATPVPTNPGADPAFQQSYWNSNNIFIGAVPDITTGIANAWIHDVAQGLWRGGPLMHEGKIMWKGQIVPWQQFVGGFYTWENGQPFWHSNS